MSKENHTGQPPEDLTLENLEQRVIRLEKYVERLSNFAKDFKWKKTPLDILKRHNREYEGVESQLTIIDRATEVLKENPYESYTPIDLLIHVCRFYDVQKQDDHYFDDKFQKLMADIETYLCHYQVKKEKWEFEIEDKDKEARTERYRRVFEDDLLILQIGEEDLQVITKLDASAYNIPLKLLREILKIKIR